MPYLAPRNPTAAGFAEISRRLAGLLRCLNAEINSAVAYGDITDDLQRFRDALLGKLQDEGWSFSYDGGQRLKVRPPGHSHPFPRRDST